MRSEGPCPPLSGTSSSFPPRWKELELQSPCRSEAFAPPIAALRRFLDHHAASVDRRTIKPLCGCCSRGLSGQQTVRTKIFGCPKWLHMAAHAAQLAAVVLDMGKSPTSDVPTTNAANYSPIEATLHPNRAVFLCVLM